MNEYFWWAGYSNHGDYTEAQVQKVRVLENTGDVLFLVETPRMLVYTVSRTDLFDTRDEAIEQVALRLLRGMPDESV